MYTGNIIRERVCHLVSKKESNINVKINITVTKNQWQNWHDLCGLKVFIVKTIMTTTIDQPTFLKLETETCIFIYK